MQGGFYVLGLGVFITPSQQDDHLLAYLFEIDPIAWSVINPHFRYTLTNRLNISRVSGRQSFNSDKDTSTGADVLQRIDPFGKSFCFADFNHENIVAIRLHLSRYLWFVDEARHLSFPLKIINFSSGLPELLVPVHGQGRPGRPGRGCGAAGTNLRNPGCGRDSLKLRFLLARQDTSCKASSSLALYTLRVRS